MAEKGPLLFLLPFSEFSNFLHFFSTLGPHYVDFTFAFDNPLIRLEMTEIWPKYVTLIQQK